MESSLSKRWPSAACTSFPLIKAGVKREARRLVKSKRVWQIKRMSFAEIKEALPTPVA